MMLEHHQQPMPILIASEDDGVIGSKMAPTAETVTDRRITEWLRLQRRQRRQLQALGETRREIEALNELLATDHGAGRRQ